jgi:hypothetical protein
MIARYAKGIVIIAGALTSIITAYYGDTSWAPLAVQGISGLVAILVPNAGKESDAVSSGKE